MSLLSWVGRKIKLTDGKFWSVFLGGETWAGETVNVDTAMQVSAFWACVRLIAKTQSTLPIGLYEPGTAGRKSRSDHPLYRILHDQPNAEQSACRFWEGLIAWSLVGGTGYAPKEFRGRQLIALNPPLNPHFMTVERTDRGALKFTYRDPSNKNKERVYTEEELFVLPGFGFGASVGLSPLQYARQSLSAARATERAAASHFANGMRPSGWLVYKGGGVLEDDQRELAKQNLINPMSGAENWGKIGILEGDFDYRQMTIAPEEAQMLESRRFSVEDVCRWHGVPPILVGHASQGQTMWGCLPAGTKVLTTAGPINIEDVAVGASVWTLDGDRMVRRRVLRSGQTGIKPLYTIKTRDRTVRATANHQFLVRRKHSTPRPGYGGYHAVEWRNEWVAAEELTTADYIVAAHDVIGGVEIGRRAPNGRIVNDRFMEFCGLYVAEGSMNDRHVTIARHRDAAYMDAYRWAMREEFTRSTARLVVNGGLSSSSVHLMEGDRSTTFSSKTAADELRELGFAGTAHTKRVPGWIFGLPRVLQLAFLRGYLDGDGHVNKHGWITWTSVNRDLIEDIRHLCIMAGVPVGEACGYPIPLWFDGSEREVAGTVWQAWCYSVPHNRHIGSHDPRYQDRWAALPDEPQRIGRFDPDYVGRGKGACRPGVGFSIQGAVLSRIHSVERGDEAEPVFDLEIDGTHNFIADGVVVHNSGVEQIMLGWYTLSLRSDLVRIEQEIKRQLMTPEEKQSGLYAEHAVEGLLRADSAARGEFYWKLMQMGVVNANWIADKENVPHHPGGDRYFINQTLAPLDETGVPIKAEPPAPAQREPASEPAQPPQRRLEVVR